VALLAVSLIRLKVSWTNDRLRSPVVQVMGLIPRYVL